MRAGSLAELPIQEDFGKLSMSPLQSWKAKTPWSSTQLRAKAFRHTSCNQTDTWAHGLSARAQPSDAQQRHPCPPGGSEITEQGHRCPRCRESLLEGGETPKPHLHTQISQPGLPCKPVQTCRFVWFKNKKIPLVTKAKEIRLHWFFSVWEECCIRRVATDICKPTYSLFKSGYWVNHGCGSNLLSSSQTISETWMSWGVCISGRPVLSSEAASHKQ